MKSPPARTAPGARDARVAGFTLIELMVSMALGFLLLGGAFEMHAAFSRQSVHQQETADMQQSLRVAAQVIGRAVRTAGAGLNGGVLDLYDSATLPQAWSLGAVQFSNSNAFPNGYPASVFDTQLGDTEAYPNPDWIRIVAFDATPQATGAASAAPGCVATSGCATVVAVSSVDMLATSMVVSDVRPFAAGSFFFAYNADYSNTPANHRVCVRRVTGIGNTNPNNSGTLLFAPTSQYNPGAGPLDSCMSQLAVNVVARTTSYVFALDRSVVFRIDTPPPNAPGAPTTPRLQAWYASSPGAIPNFYPEAVPNWQTLTENIEDLQVAALMSNGTICGAKGYSTDDATPVTGLCQPQNIRALRFTLVARSSSPFSGWTLGGIPGGIEDETPIPNDAYLRRRLTEEVQVRNVPSGGL